MRIRLRHSGAAISGVGLAGLLQLCAVEGVWAAEFKVLDNQVTGSFDSTLSYGRLWRVQGRDKTNDDVNTNDGNRNFDTGLVSEVYKITSELEANYQNYGVFMRGTAFYDTQLMDKRNDYYHNNSPSQPSQSYPNDDHFTDQTRDIAGSRIEMLDAYVYGNWDVAQMPVTARLGRQVFNWGEGIFYRGGINTTNPVDAAKYRLPGAEVKEVLMPVEAVSFNIGLSDNLTMESFYQTNWKETRIDPVGTFYSQGDLFADGGNTGYNNFTGTALDTPVPGFGNVIGLYEALGNNPALNQILGSTGLYANGVTPAYGNTLKVASIGKDINARNDGQFGFAFRYIAEELNSTEFGLYMVNYHAKEPTIAANLGGYKGIDMDALTNLLSGLAGSQAGALANGLATADVMGNIQANRRYAEDIRMYGFSFNTTLGQASVFGELAYRPNLPIGIAATNDLIGDLANGAAAAVTGQSINVGGQMVTLDSQINNAERVEAFNTSLGSIYNFGPTLSFDSMFGVFELASEHLRGSSLQYTAFDGSNRYYAGTGNTSYVSGGDRDDQINRDSYSYTLMVNGTWNDVYAGVNVSPYAVYKDDFKGNSYQAGNTIEGRKAYTLGIKANYQNKLEAELQYTEFYGGGQNNSIRDRDNVGFNLKYFL
ncbi:MULTISPECIES: DUF1302 domain-containing protein [Pseudomonas]|jgi:hypothetical protein|uniref:DUF1302 domain-containing protein n=1 Tax=Pseudomonas kielensis TaxID=2762577 RepID=A0A7X1KY12_9PSED|nr:MULTISPECIES: DUF1302 domain-containing protein [Pseudomonas]MBC2690970.1 DUF1302 domain-containing protein [Pseudomonas kielensis]NBB34200.1 DUF1302 family protein [Pseudomonas sp. BC115LW]UZM13735.1 DUF1302 domain-containing protein [Pseudomonas kielensis]WKL54246.1 DUF1302 domain-containing protein [Pseudomonas kielensis]